MEAKLEPENTDLDDSNLKGDNPPAFEARDQNPHHVGYDQPSPRDYNLPQHCLRMQTRHSTVVSVQPALTVAVPQPRDLTDLTIPSMFIYAFCCPLTGIFAIIFAIKAQGLYDEGRKSEAEQRQRWTRYLMLASVLIPLFTCVPFIIMYLIDSSTKPKY